jgi:hypothetical protein
MADINKLLLLKALGSGSGSGSKDCDDKGKDMNQLLLLSLLNGSNEKNTCNGGVNFKNIEELTKDCVGVEIIKNTIGCLPCQEFELCYLIWKKDPRIEDYMQSDTFSIKFTKDKEVVVRGKELVETIRKFSGSGTIKSVLFKGTLEEFINKIDERLPMYWSAYMGNGSGAEYDLLIKLKEGWSGKVGFGKAKAGRKVGRKVVRKVVRKKGKGKRSKKKVLKGWFGGSLL